MRDTNKAIVHGCQNTSYLFEQFKVIESFWSDFSYLVLGRDNIICRNYVFSLQRIFNSSQATLGNIIECCKCFCLADAYILLRKYRDDLFFCLYLVTYDANAKLGELKHTKKMETNIEQWCQDNLSNLNINEVLTTIGTSKWLQEAVRKYDLQKSFGRVGRQLNNYVHGNGFSFYNTNANSFDEKNIEEQLNAIVSMARYITTTFLFLLSLCSPHYIMSTDYIDHLEFGQTPPDGSQYWVAPFVAEYLNANIEMIDKNGYEYLKENTCMAL